MELLREREKGVLRAAHPRTPFQGEYPLGIEQGKLVNLPDDMKWHHPLVSRTDWGSTWIENSTVSLCRNVICLCTISRLFTVEKKNHDKATKKETVLRADGPSSRVNLSGHFFFFLVAKMTPIKIQKSSKQSDVFLWKIWKSILSYFRKISSQIFFDFG